MFINIFIIAVVALMHFYAFSVSKDALSGANIIGI